MYSIYGLQFTSEGADRYTAWNEAHGQESIRVAVLNKLCDVYDEKQFELLKSPQKFMKFEYGTHIYTLNVLNEGDILISQFGRDETMLAFAFVKDKRVES